MKIILYPNDLLTTPSQKINVNKFGLNNLEKLGKKMIKTMRRARGVGLAATQIGKGIRLCVIHKHAGNLDEDLILINPLITVRSTQCAVVEEGCLSLPGTRVNIERPVRITLCALHTDGSEITFQAEDFFARVIQHEVDHLDGILIIDHQT